MNVNVCLQDGQRRLLCYQYGGESEDGEKTQRREGAGDVSKRRIMQRSECKGARGLRDNRVSDIKRSVY